IAAGYLLRRSKDDLLQQLHGRANWAGSVTWPARDLCQLLSDCHDWIEHRVCALRHQPKYSSMQPCRRLTIGQLGTTPIELQSTAGDFQPRSGETKQCVD